MDSTEPDAGLELMNCEIMTWAETKSQMLNQLSHAGTLALFTFNYFFRGPIFKYNPIGG